MIVSDQNKFVFIKTRKTAGTSIEIALSSVAGERDVLSLLQGGDEANRHEATGRRSQNDRVPICRYSGIDYYEVLKKRHFIRFREHDSAARIRKYMDQGRWSSYFKFCFERNPFDRAISLFFWSQRNQRTCADINEYLLKVPGQLLSNWDLYNENGFLQVDFVGRYEHLKEDFRKVCQKVGIDSALNLPRIKNTIRPIDSCYKNLINNEVRHRIEIVCAREIRLLGYQW